MTPYLDTNRLDRAEAEMEMDCCQLLTPLTRYANARPDAPFAVDNGAFSRLDLPAFRSLLTRELPRRHLCRFVCVPDAIATGMPTEEDKRRNREPQAIGNAALTRVLWDRRRRAFPFLHGWPLAYVLQDGAEAPGNVPWDDPDLAAVFVGGSTDWKCGPHAAALVKTAKALGLWVHAGRINGPDRWRHFEALGADSADGTGLVRTTRQREAIRDRHVQRPAPAPLLDALAPSTP